MFGCALASFAALSVETSCARSRAFARPIRQATQLHGSGFGFPLHVPLSSRDALAVVAVIGSVSVDF